MSIIRYRHIIEIQDFIIPVMTNITVIELQNQVIQEFV